jgi:hypothetical protein
VICADLVLPKVEAFCAPLPCEKVTTLKVMNYGTGSSNPLPDLTRVADVFIPGCKAGDLLEVESAFQATNNKAPHNVEFTGKLIFTTDPNGVFGFNISHKGKALGGLGLGFNISPAMHHGVMHLTGTFCVPFDCDGYVAAILYAGGDSYLTNAWVPLDSGGHLNVKRTRR